jgi:hypothetical protein
MSTVMTTVFPAPHILALYKATWLRTSVKILWSNVQVCEVLPGLGSSCSGFVSGVTEGITAERLEDC